MMVLVISPDAGDGKQALGKPHYFLLFNVVIGIAISGQIQKMQLYSQKKGW